MCLQQQVQRHMHWCHNCNTIMMHHKEQHCQCHLWIFKLTTLRNSGLYTVRVLYPYLITKIRIFSFSLLVAVRKKKKYWYWLRNITNYLEFNLQKITGKISLKSYEYLSFLPLVLLQLFPKRLVYFHILFLTSVISRIRKFAPYLEASVTEVTTT